jgi:hypothetical protein
MLSTISPAAFSVLENFVRSAQVCQVIDATQIRIKLQHDKQEFDLWASFAMGNMPLPQVGDKVLVAGEDLQSGFIIGHLDLRSEQGSIRLQAAKNIELNSPQFTLQSAKAELNMAETQYQGLRLSASIAHSKLFLGKLNTTVGRLIEKAKNVYRQVDNLNQLKAGRMRSLVKGSYHLKSESINQKAVKEVRIDGDKINLG